MPLPPTADVLIAADCWQAQLDAEAIVQRAIAAAASTVELPADETEIAEMLTDDARIRDLNREWRGQDKATNVLSFPAAQPPGPTPQPLLQGEVVRPAADSWLVRAIRSLFGWKAGSARADIQVVLDATAPDDETSFTAVERTMLRNILALHDRRIADVMVPRADIVAVRRDISLAELKLLFDSAGHSRLVVYNDTLDEPEGIVHIRDLVAFITSKAKVDPEANAKRKKPFPAGLDLKSVNLGLKLSETPIMRELLYVPPSLPAIDESATPPLSLQPPSRRRRTERRAHVRCRRCFAVRRTRSDPELGLAAA